MEYLPVFADLNAKSVLVVGGGDIAVRKIAQLRRAGAKVQVVAAELCSELQDLAERGEVDWLARSFDEKQIDNVLLIIAATSDSTLNGRVSQAAGKVNRLVNVVDDQPKCSFIFPSIIDRSPLLLAISSSGRAPVLVRLLREKLEALLPAHLGQMVTIAGAWRNKVKQRLATFSARRRYWEQAFNGRFASQIAAGDVRQAEKTLQQQLDSPEKCQGEIALVGAGPGDAGLLTLRALQVMQCADVVLYDHLVSDEVLDLIRRDAQRICVGKRAAAHTVSQENINRQLVMLAQQGKRVVRLKGGDPFIFGRGGEELQAARCADIPFQVVPGVTAAMGATAYAGIPLTHRDYARSVLFITGHCRPEGKGIDWRWLTCADQTLAIYMGTMNAAEISEQLMAHGRAGVTPVAVISRATRHDQQVQIGTLEHLGVLASRAPAPALLVIGDVVCLHSQLAWFRSGVAQTAEGSALINLV